MATSDDHSARADRATGLREFLIAMYPGATDDINTLIERFKTANNVDRPATSDMSNFETYLRACIKGQNTTDAFP